MNRADQDRIEGRRWAEEVLSGLIGESVDYQLGFWRHMKRQLSPREINPKAMMDVEVREFGKSIVGFGKFVGMRWDDVPFDYLEWLTDENSKLRRYLENRRIKEERARESV